MKVMFKLSAVGLLVMLFVTTAYSYDHSMPLIIDHTCTELSLIPLEWIDSVQANWRLHYAHTSHGGQLTTGLNRLENADATYNIAIGSSHLPTVPDAFCIFDGQEGDTYITPDMYWQTTEGMNMTRDVLNHHPTINTSMWAWCCQLNYYSEEEVQAYLDSMAVLEREYPQVTFVYLTGNAQATGSEGYNRYLRNEQIRQYCIANNKVLFDFADLDSWWFNPDTQEWEHATYEHNGHTVSVEHQHFHGNEAGHTTYESCEQKGKAVWWMMARLTGWSGSQATIEGNSVGPQRFSLDQNYPNPFNPVTEVRYSLPRGCQVRLEVYNLLGQKVASLVEGKQKAGYKSVRWDGSRFAAGLYFYRLKAGDFTQTRRMILVK